MLESSLSVCSIAVGAQSTLRSCSKMRKPWACSAFLSEVSNRIAIGYHFTVKVEIQGESFVLEGCLFVSKRWLTHISPGGSKSGGVALLPWGVDEQTSSVFDRGMHCFNRLVSTCKPVQGTLFVAQMIQLYASLSVVYISNCRILENRIEVLLIQIYEDWLTSC